MKSDCALTSIVVVQRERFSMTRESLESLLANTKPPFELIYVDAGSPTTVATYLHSQSLLHGFRLIRVPRHLPPVEARNLGFGASRGRYVVFTDNDVVFSEGWLRTLVECAAETGADIVTPLICYGEPVHTIVHVAGGTAVIGDNGDGRSFREVQRFEGRPVSEVFAKLLREPTGLAEFHCVLVRRDFVERLGGFDENLKSTSEHLDLALTAQACGGRIWFEPASRITYMPPGQAGPGPGRRLAWSDLPYFALRWSDEWNEASEKYFHAKWGVEYRNGVVLFGRDHRRKSLAGVRRTLLQLLGWRLSEAFSDGLDLALAAVAKRRGAAGRATVRGRHGTAH
ncbi:MAG: glycosyltransferase family 2 protein [Myxococcales bacterium]|jgi:GT2 family glycosyltransferase